MTFLRSFTLVFLFFSCAHAAMADTQYINDEVYVPVRSGAGNQFRIIHKGIKSGTKLDVKETSSDGDWVRVVTESGLEGWVRKQYLTSKPTAQLLLTNAQLNAEKKSAQVAYLQTELQTLKTQMTELESSCGQIESNKNTCDLELKEIRALSADAINLGDRYQRLLAKHDMTQTQFDTLQAENDRLRSDGTINQWLMGAGLVFSGVLLTFVLSGLKGKSRQSEWKS